MRFDYSDSIVFHYNIIAQKGVSVTISSSQGSLSFFLFCNVYLFSQITYILWHVLLCREKVEEALDCCSTIKKATSDLNVQTFEEELAIEQVVIDNLVENNENEESVDLVKSNENDKEIDILDQENEKKERGDDDLVKKIERKGSENVGETPKVPNYRYQNCAASEDDCDEDLQPEGSEINDGNGDSDDLGSNRQMFLVQEESSDSLFSLSIESRKQVCEVELGEKEVNSPMPKCSANQKLDEARDGSQCFHSVLNPVENLTQWKVIKARAATTPFNCHNKENINFCPEPSFKLTTWSLKLNPNKKNEVVDGDVAVDTSLSSWLVDPEATPMSNTSIISDGNSSQNREDKPILGDLTVEEVKELSVPTSARQSRRCRSPDEPKVGTIGSYWSHTGKVINSDSGSSSQGMPKRRSKNCEVR